MFKWNGNIPEKPETQEEQINMLWDGVFNHLPHRLAWLNIKINFILTFMAIELGLTGFAIALIMQHMGK